MEGDDVQSLRVLNRARGAFRDARLFSEFRPSQHGLLDVAKIVFCASAFHRSEIGARLEVIEGEIGALAVQAHLMRMHPPVLWVKGIGEIISRRKRPLPGAVHQERNVLDVIVLIAGDDVECHPPELLFDSFHRQAEFADGLKGLLIGVGTRLIVIVMLHGAE